ncbi:uncharacterized protein LOC128714853 [Anopheles marshallii]|uniref:uncharacterized protein LOC128714853 n=1 Tax=Anopheles marshallii TaxID=1521116 RepID=UPI00237B6E0C|nr:uncharacterized protein LOC128714853 [Anopheles marshallii]
MPNSKCAAAFCSNKRAEAKKRKLDIIFHAFPSEEALKTKWIQFCKRGANWNPYKTDAICSVHFKKNDYQMANSPRVWSKNLRRLNLNAFPSVMAGSVITISKKQKLDEQTRKKLLRELYHNTTLDEQSTDRDHTYSEGTIEELKDTSLMLQKIVYRLQRFPNVCALCFKAIADEKMFSPFAYYHDELECTIEQKFEEFAGVSLTQEDRANLSHLLPDKVCVDCLEALIIFHQYQRQMECMRKFSTGLAHLLKGNRNPLQDLYEEQGTHLANVLKSLNICHGSEDTITLERLEQEVATYGRVRKYTVFNQVYSVDKFQTDANMQSQEDITQSRPNLRRSPKQESDDNFRSKKWICPYEDICREWFLDEASLQEHVRDGHKCFKCPTCGAKIKFYDLYKKHVNSHAVARALLLSHNNKRPKQKLWNCGNCRKVFRSEEHLKCHEKIHSDSKHFVCRVCLGVFVSKNRFYNHKCIPSSTDLTFSFQDDFQYKLEEDSNSSGSELNTTSPNNSSRNVELLSIEILQ